MINPPADGRCWWSCLYLHLGSTATRMQWFEQARSQQGFPDATRLAEETQVVYRFAMGIVKAALQSADATTLENDLVGAFCMCLFIEDLIIGV